MSWLWRRWVYAAVVLLAVTSLSLWCCHVLTVTSLSLCCRCTPSCDVVESIMLSCPGCDIVESMLPSCPGCDIVEMILDSQWCGRFPRVIFTTWLHLSKQTHCLLLLSIPGCHADRTIDVVKIMNAMLFVLCRCSHWLFQIVFWLARVFWPRCAAKSQSPDNSSCSMTF